MIKEAPYQIKQKDRPLEGLDLVVVGAGPGGLVTARSFERRGAQVRVLESRDDPRGRNDGSTYKSFNFTVNHIGRRSLQTPEAYADGTPAYGRAIHRDGEVTYTRYGQGRHEDRIVCIPRPTFRKNLLDLTEGNGAEFAFNSEVREVDPNEGVVVFRRDGKEERFHGDLVVIADGVHSIGDGLVEQIDGGKIKRYFDPLQYVTARLSAELGLSRNHLHFWNEEYTTTHASGVPNRDGSVSVLFISEFSDIDSAALPFADMQLARERLERDFPQLFKLNPGLVDQLIGKKRGSLPYKSTSHFVVGDRGVLVGDAGRAVPPWKGLGANSAAYGAESLVHLLMLHEGDLAAALTDYQVHHRALSEIVLPAVQKQGENLARQPEEPSKGTLTELVYQASYNSGVYIDLGPDH